MFIRFTMGTTKKAARGLYGGQKIVEQGACDRFVRPVPGA